MECAICRQGKTHVGTATVTLERGDSTIVIKGVPAEVCQDCGEYYLSEETAANIEKMASKAAEAGVVVEVLRYAA